MPIPSMKDFFVPCLRLLAKDARNAKDCLSGLRAEFHLTDSEMDEMVPSGTRGRVFDRADWAIFHLMKAGLVDRPNRGVYLTSDAGRALLASGVKALSNADLAAMPAYQAAMSDTKQNGSGTPGSVKDISVPTPTNDSQPPEDIMASAHAELDQALRDDILDRLITMNPIRFERLILDLLKAMGYGAGALGAHLMTKASGDGGIDGIIHEDALGLDAVYIQAKRYAPHISVGRPAIQQFIGSLTGEGATKGVFVTTSDFSKDARDYLTKVQHRVVLINGRDLARLMIAHGVGVRDRMAYVIRGVDEDYFADPEG